MKRTMNLLTVLLFLFFSTEAFSITISGGPNACIGIAKTLSIDTAGGTWSISDPARATIVPATGVLTGLSIGTASVSYTIGSAVFTAPVLIYPQPGSITGTASTCSGISTTLSSSGAGSGVWSSSNTAVATIGTGSGVLTGVAAGTTIITFTRTLSGCFVTRTQTVLASPAAISGASSMCVSTTQTLTGTPAGGTWTRSNAAVANIGASTGVLNALVAGSTNVVYTLPGGCNTSTAITVVTIPAAITGYTTTCIGNNTTLASATSGGTWTAATPSVATIGSTTGIVTGAGSGTSLITYTMGTGCSRTATVTVNAALSAIAGSTTICTGQTGTLTNATTGGTWSSSNTAVATVGMSTGIVSGITAGTAIISYRSAGCYATTTVTISSLPAAITGLGAVCLGASITLAHTATGGSWSSSNPSTASVNVTTGVVTGVNIGIATISYFVSPGCYTTKPIGVNPLPNNISGDSALCIGANTTYTNTTPGGTWSSSNTSVATVAAATGIITGISYGTAGITYTTGSGCIRSKVVTVSAGPASAGTISGPVSVDVGSVITLSSTVSGGTWSSSGTVATVGATSGIVTGISAGTASITYTVTNSCGSLSATRIVTVGATSPITGTLTLCAGNSTTLANATSGGTWSSSNPAIGSVGSASGIVTGIGIGTTTISYVSGVGTATAVVTVSSTPATYLVTGGGNYCSGGAGVPIGLAGSSVGINYKLYLGGTLVSSSVSGTGGAINFGTYSVAATYTALATNAASGCSTSMTGSAVVAVIALPAAYTVTGGGSYCSGGVPIGLAFSQSGVNYQLYNGASAVGGSVSGIGAAISLGTFTTTGTYTVLGTNVATGCVRSMTGTATVTLATSVSPITGTTIADMGSTTTLSDATSGGIWSSSNATVATIGITSGIVTGLSAGTSIISYMTGASCYATTVVTISDTASLFIGGPYSAAVGSTVSLSLYDLTGHIDIPGGVWSSSNPSIATISGGEYATVTAISAGTVTISYVVTDTTGTHTYTRSLAALAVATHPVTITASKPGTATDKENLIHIYPNPTNSDIYIDAPVNGHVSVHSVDGRLITNEVINTGTNKISVPADLARGLYLVKFIGEDGTTHTTRIVLN